MLLSHSRKFIYLKTRKTAGTSVEIFFEPWCLPDTGQHAEKHAIAETVSDAGIVGSRMEAGAPVHRFYNHMPASEVRSAVGREIFDAYFKFCVVRNPFDKIVSAFWWRQSRRNPHWEALAAANFGDVRIAFSQFVRTARLPIDKDIYAIDGAIVVDEFIRYESLEADLTRICARLGIDSSNRTLGVYKGGVRLRSEPYRDYYDPESAGIVRDVYAWDIQQLGYAF